jgi:hypothetical protein
LYRGGMNAPMERIPGVVAKHPIRPESMRRCMAASDIRPAPRYPDETR